MSFSKSFSKSFLFSIGFASCSVFGLSVGQSASASTLAIDDYLFVATGNGKDNDGKNVFDTSSDEYGAIDADKPSGSAHDQPSPLSEMDASDRPTFGIDQSGDVAILDSRAEISQLSSTRIHTKEGSGDGDGDGGTVGTGGTLNPSAGMRGFDCAGTQKTCNGGNSGNSVPSSSDYNLSSTDTANTPNIVGIDGANDAMYYGVDLSDVEQSVEDTEKLFDDISAASVSDTIGPDSLDVVQRQNLSEFSGTKTFDLTGLADGLFIFDLVTSADKWELSSNFLEFNLNPFQYVVLLPTDGKAFSMTSSGLYEVGGDVLNNIAVYVDDVDSAAFETSFAISSSVWNGVSFYDLDNSFANGTASRNLTDISSSVGCGHWINSSIKTSESSFTQCAFGLDTPEPDAPPPPPMEPVPVPAAFSLLLSGVGIMTYVRRRRRHQS